MTKMPARNGWNLNIGLSKFQKKWSQRKIQSH